MEWFRVVLMLLLSVPPAFMGVGELINAYQNKQISGLFKAGILLLMAFGVAAAGISAAPLPGAYKI
jgi:hypothetical protein